MKPGEARSLKRSAGLWSLAISVALHVAFLGLLPRRPGSAPQGPAPRPGPAVTRVELFDARVGSGAVRPAGVRPPGIGTRALPDRPSHSGESRARGQSPRALATVAVPAPATAPVPVATPAPGVVPAPVDARATSPVVPAPPPLAEVAGGSGEVEPGPAVAPATAAPGGGGGGGASGSGGPGGKTPAGGEESVARAAIGALHQRLAAAALRCYPPAARRFRARGEVMVSFCLDAGGNATSVTQVAGSGSALLDRAAIECVIPGALPAPGAPGCYRIPVVFGDAP